MTFSHFLCWGQLMIFARLEVSSCPHLYNYPNRWNKILYFSLSHKRSCSPCYVTLTFLVKDINVWLELMHVLGTKEQEDPPTFYRCAGSIWMHMALQVPLAFPWQHYWWIIDTPGTQIMEVGWWLFQWCEGCMVVVCLISFLLISSW